MVNRAMALSLWPDGESPVGKRLWLPLGQETPSRIVAMAEDFASQSLPLDRRPSIFIPWEHWTPQKMHLVVKGTGDPVALAPSVRAAIWSADDEVPIQGVRSMEEVVNRTLADSRLFTFLLTVFGAMPLLLGAVGVYGVASFSVAQRKFEIGIRMALGASRTGVMADVLGRFLSVAAVGVGLGTCVGLVVTRVLAGFLYQVSATDPGTFLGVGLFLGLVAVGAVALPAIRAGRVEPVQALRQE